MRNPKESILLLSSSNVRIWDNISTERELSVKLRQSKSFQKSFQELLTYTKREYAIGTWSLITSCGIQLLRSCKLSIFRSPSARNTTLKNWVCGPTLELFTTKPLRCLVDNMTKRSIFGPLESLHLNYWWEDFHLRVSFIEQSSIKSLAKILLRTKKSLLEQFRRNCFLDFWKKILAKESPFQKLWRVPSSFRTASKMEKARSLD